MARLIKRCGFKLVELLRGIAILETLFLTVVQKAACAKGRATNSNRRRSCELTMQYQLTKQYQLFSRVGMFEATQQRIVSAGIAAYKNSVSAVVDETLVALVTSLDPRYAKPGGTRVQTFSGNVFTTLGSIDVEEDDEVGMETTPDCWSFVPGAGVSLSTMPATSDSLRRKIAKAVVDHTGWSVLDCQQRLFISPEDVI